MAKDEKITLKVEPLTRTDKIEPIEIKSRSRLTFSGPAEHTAGYQCPVRGEFTNPYALDEDNLCKACGYKLNVG